MKRPKLQKLHSLKSWTSIFMRVNDRADIIYFFSLFIYFVV